MTRHLLHRVASALAIATLLLAAMASPVSAGKPAATLMVDDNGVQCPSAGYSSIQDAIDVANNGDTVIVCPGHYAEQLVISEAITVRAWPRFSAHIDVPMLSEVDGAYAAVRIDASNAAFKGFRLHFETGDLPGLAPSLLSCTEADAAILVTGLNNVVRYNRIDTVGEQSLSGLCGYEFGIVLAGGVNVASAKILFNKIINFKHGGILVEGDGTTALVRRNDIRYIHAAENVETPCITTWCATAGVIAKGVNGDLPDSFGIGLENEADARIIRNAVRSGPDAAPAFPIGPEGPPTVRPTGDSGGTPALSAGIAVASTDSGDTIVKHNAVWRAIHGIHLSSSIEDVDTFENHVTLSFEWGILLEGSDSHIYDNVVNSNFQGVRVYGQNNTFTDNDFRNNAYMDCFDSTTGGFTAGTNSFWTNNLGEDDYPDGICID